MTHDTGLIVREPDLGLAFVKTPEQALEELREFQAFIQKVMIKGEDYGVIPGTPKPTLLKPGAEKICELYGFAPEVEVINRVEDWEGGFFHYEIRCSLVSKRSGQVVAQGVGSCNSKEARYRWREGRRSCPTCGAEAIIKGKEEYGGGWVCFKKQGGCGAKYEDKDPVIEAQKVGRMENDDPFTLVNTIEKMAKKRALVDAALSATRSSGIFTQDIEDEDFHDRAVVIETTARPIPEKRQGPPISASPAKVEWGGFWAAARKAGFDQASAHEFFNVRPGKDMLLRYAETRALEEQRPLQEIVDAMRLAVAEQG